jgi:hypothetical protein
MWTVLRDWVVGDLGIELSAGEPWSTVLEVSTADAEPLPSEGPFRCEIANDPLSIAGPVYDIVARLDRDENSESFLDADGIILTPQVFTPWPSGTVLAFQSELSVGFDLRDPAPEHLVHNFTVQQLFIREWDAVSDGAPRSYRRDPQTLRIRPIQRMQMWELSGGLDGPNKVLSDYLLELT